MPVRVLGIGAALVIAFVATPVLATNGVTPRAPPIFKRMECLTVIDKRVDPIWHLDFAIPFEDTVLTEDEPADARTLQFFALCRDRHEQAPLPSWIDDDDVQRSIAAGALELPPPPDDVLAGHPDWPADCVQPINLAADRIPMSCAATADAIDWDTSAVPPGNYVIYGYTFAPAVNLWTPRTGVVRVIDGDDAAIAPVVSLMSPRGDAMAYAAAGYRIVGCAAGVTGTTVTVSWAKIADDLSDDASWRPIAEPFDAAEGSFDLSWSPPAEAINQAVVVRAIAIDPQGRSHTSHADGKVIVVSGDGRSDPPDLPAGPDFCGVYPELPSDDGASEGSGGALTTGDDTDPIEDDTSGSAAHGDETAAGCGCRHTPRAAAWWAMSVLVLARRRDRTPAASPRALLPEKASGRRDSAVET